MTSCTHSHPYAESHKFNSDFPSFFSSQRKTQNRVERLLDGGWRTCLWACVMLAGCMPIAARAAVFVQVASATPQSPQASVSVTYPSAQAAGDLNVVVVGWNDATSAVNSVKDSAGNIYQLAVGPTVGTGLEQSIYYAPNIAGGSNTVTVTFSQAATAPDVRILEYQGASRLDVAVGKKGSSSSTSSGAATTTGPNELIVAANTVATLTKTVGSGFTSRIITTPDGDIAEDKMATAAGSNSAASALSSSGPWVMQMVAFAASAAPAQPALSGVSCSSGSMTGVGTDSCTVTLNAAAASGGVAVSLASNNSAVTVPASLTVAAGAASASFTATVATVSTATAVTLTASASVVSKTFAIQLGASTPTLGVSSASLSFGSNSVNSATTQTITLSSTGNAAVTISAATISGSGFTVSGATFPLTLNPNQTASLTVQFDPTAAGAATGTLTLTSNSSSGTSTAVSLSGTGMPVLTGLACANGSMTGAGPDNCTVSLNAAAATRGFALSLASNNSAVTVPASVTVPAGSSSANFTATVSSVSTAATVSLTASTASVSKTFTLQLGAGTTTLNVNATTIAFGNVNLSSPATQTVTLTSTGTLPVVISSATVLGTGFTVLGATLPLTLSANQTATLSVEFDPTTVGSASGTLTIASTSTTNPANVIALTGTGISTSYEVNLTWSAPESSSDPVAGYNVYRAPSGSTSYEQISTSVVTQTAYTDSSVQTGQTYDYIVESVDASGLGDHPKAAIDDQVKSGHREKA